MRYCQNFFKVRMDIGGTDVKLITQNFEGDKTYQPGTKSSSNEMVVTGF